MSEHRRRRQAILELIAASAIGTQEELADALARRGFEVSQSSVSRDIATLGLAKSGGRWVRSAATSRVPDPMLARIRDNVLEIRQAGEHLVVLITPPGEASAVGVALDRQSWPEIVGTLAGDDTIFVAVTGSRGAEALKRRLRRKGV